MFVLVLSFSFGCLFCFLFLFSRGLETKCALILLVDVYKISFDFGKKDGYKVRCFALSLCEKDFVAASIVGTIALSYTITNM